MNIRFNKYILLFIVFLSVINARSVELPAELNKAFARDSSYQKIRCDIFIEVDVPGLNMPAKTVNLVIEKGKEPKVKGDGILLIPKRGMMGQLNQLLNTPFQSIKLSEVADTVTYKLVSLSHKSDWVTVDIAVDKVDYKIHQLIITTRENGTFFINHFYGYQQHPFPVLTVISFEAMPIKLPLKFLGRTTGMENVFNSEDPVTGKVKLKYLNIQLQ